MRRTLRRCLRVRQFPSNYDSFNLPLRSFSGSADYRSRDQPGSNPADERASKLADHEGYFRRSKMIPRMFICLLVSLATICDVWSEPFRQSLDGRWRLWNSNRSLALPARVPGCVHSALTQQGFIQDPYFRFNDLAHQWISLDNWTYVTTFAVSDRLRSAQKVLLILDGVDTAASVWLNGVLVGHADNMFRQYVFPVRELLEEENVNVLRVDLLSPVLYANERRKAHWAYRVPPECPPDVQKGQCHVNFIRKEQSSFSWDWGPSFPTMGLWKGVRLEAFDAMRLVRFSAVPLRNASLSQWTVRVELLVEALRPARVDVTLAVPELSSQLTVASQFLPGTTRHVFTLHVNTSSQVRLWWPSGLGERPSYRLLVTASSQDGLPLLHTESKVYFRTVDLVQEPIADSPGLSFYFRVNGRPVFLKGSNWIPAHAFQDQVTPDALKNLLQSAVDANMNALRVWGGGVYEQDVFYSMCDEMGLMVWQDFMFACATYPTDDDFINTVREEVIQQVRSAFLEVLVPESTCN
ncbi:beta-mannosidase-like [Entelurus aequoreus]|uniref:beta-mannosidase-like n=1 Tax=Entelurus aequoreus TaxID=161455 RepID=UPI002B1D9D65|nr:beta-mannosidase-like [Entelurus aequoreus]